jgi:4-diphosphocytidyl-2-C-methyl-D-erythritol kinase
MIQFAPCKINLGLSITSKRTDGYHELETVFYPVPLHDIVEIIHAPNAENKIQFTHSGIPVPGDENNNLCIKAFQLLKNNFPNLPNVQMHLHKHIPMGAGLGGGSSDATTVLKILNQIFQLHLSQEKLVEFAAQLGSDCPFFVYDTAQHATGRGELLKPIEIDLSNYTIALVHPQIHISTAWAFSQLHPHVKTKSISEIVKQPIPTWKQELINDFEVPIFNSHPILAELKQYLYREGAIYASMSGSGSSLFGLFPKGQKLSPPTFQEDIRIDLI